MFFQQALQIVDSYIAQVPMTRPQHLEAQQAIAALEKHYKDALAAIEEKQAQLDKLTAKPLHRD